MMSDKVAFFHAEKRDITHNARLKRYPGGAVELLVSSQPVFRECGWESSDNWDNSTRKTVKLNDDRERGVDPSCSDRARRRAAAAVRDIVLCNEFRWFVTLTLNKERIDRYDMKAVTKKLNTWLDNRVRRNGLKYVLVPELHKDGAIHFHGFFNDALPVISSGTFTGAKLKKPRRPRSDAERRKWEEAGAHEVFNLPDWALGFSTAIEIYGDYNAATGYICKYVRKQVQKIGGRWYYSGGELEKPLVELFDVDYYDAANMEGCYTFAVPEAGLSFCRVTDYNKLPI